MHQDRRNDRGKRQHEEDVGNVRADDVADGDPDGAFVDRLKAGHEFRDGCAETDQRQADYQLRNIEFPGHAYRPAHQRFPADQQQNEPSQDQ